MFRFQCSHKRQLNTWNVMNTFVKCMLFLTFVNFVTRNYYWLFIAFALFMLTPNRTVSFNVSTLFLMIMGAMMLVFNGGTKLSVTDFLKPFVFLMAFMIGAGMPTESSNPKNASQQIERYIYLCALGFFVHYILNFITNIGSLQRDTIDFWTNTVLSATGQASLATMGVAVIAAILFSHNSIWRKIAAISVALVIVAYNMILAGRTLLYMLAIAVACAFLLRCIYYKRSIPPVVLTVVLLVAIVTLVYNLNLFNIRDLVEESNLYLRWERKNGLGIAGDLRFEYKKFYLERLRKYPFGGGHIRTECFHYAHDLYLDTYDQYSVFAFLAVAIYIIHSLVRLIRCLLSSCVSFHTKQLVLCVYVLLNIQFWLEPIMDGMPFLLVAYCFIDGVLSRYLAEHCGT